MTSTSRNRQWVAALFDALIAMRKEILIAAPTLAEIIRFDESRPIPRVPNVEVVAFDDRAAEVLGRAFPSSVIHAQKLATGLHRDYLKYDAMIVACAIRHKADCFITLDGPLTTFAQKVNILTNRPDDFVHKQTVLPLPPLPLK